MLGAYGTSAIELNRQPLCCAVSIFHPLAQKDRLEIDDLNGQNLMVIERNWMREIDILELNRQPLCCAVSIFHPLAQKDRLEIDDLNGQNLMVIERNWMREIDILREDLEKNHPLIHLKNFSFYNVDIFNECENNDAILIAVPLWQSVHPLLKIIPVNWNHSTSFGLFHNPNPSSTVRKFLDTIAQIKYS